MRGKKRHNSPALRRAPKQEANLNLRTRLHFSRRSLLRLGSGFFGSLGLASLPAWRAVAQAAEEAGGTETHGLSTFGDLALPADFPQFAYVNPEAPKGGQILLQPGGGGPNSNPTTFNTLNVFILKGDGAAGMGAIFDNLMAANSDEPDSFYGLVASKVWISADKNLYRFFLRKEARFHDGTPLTAHDVAFSLGILKSQGHPVIRQSLRDFDSAEAEADDVLLVRLKPGHMREAALAVVSQPIFSAAYYSKQPFNETTLESPLGSGAYKVGDLDQGHFISFTRVADYWGKDLPVNRGQSNFNTVRYEYFSDRKVAFEAFKAAVYTFREEFTSAVWSTGYDFPAVKDGRVKRESLPDELPLGTQAWFLNLRRDKFKDIRIREALGFAFDFEWTNRYIMYSLYRRTISYFQNSPMVASGKPSPEELQILEPFRKQVLPTVFDEAYVPPVSDGSGEDRTLLRQANDLLLAAGCKRQDSSLLLPDGKPFQIEFLDFDNGLEPHTAAYIKNLNLLGIAANFRVVDPSQYKERTDNFDYDVVTSRFGLGLTPGEAMREYFGSEAASLPGSVNVSGIADPVIDALIAQALVVDTRAKLTFICRCIDRILRAGHYWVPMWNKPNHLVAYWDLFSRPPQSAKYDIGVGSTWWYDTQKVARITLPSH
jgi:microcin C transport system substrate-binding protein